MSARASPRNRLRPSSNVRLSAALLTRTFAPSRTASSIGRYSLMATVPPSSSCCAR